jgi:hypothetical protein
MDGDSCKVVILLNRLRKTMKTRRITSTLAKFEQDTSKTRAWSVPTIYKP